MNTKKLISTILAATLTAAVCSHIAFGSGIEQDAENTSAEITAAEVTEESAELESVFAGGSGTEEDPYLISTAEQLAAIDDSIDYIDKCYKLTNDITLPSDWKMIKYIKDEKGQFYDFTGTLDGAGYTITMSWIDNSSNNEDTYQAEVGIFYFNMGVIKNLCIMIEETDKQYTDYPEEVAPLCVYNFGTITNCKVSGTYTVMFKNAVSGIEFVHASVGGIVSENCEGGIISNCSSDLCIRTNGNVNLGGIAGINGGLEYSNDKMGIIENCYSTGKFVSYSCEYVGGIVGKNKGMVKNSYANIQSITGKNTGALIDYNSDTAIVANSYYYVPKGANGDNKIGTSVSYEDLRKLSTFKGWDFVTTWGIDENINKGEPYLLWERYGGELGLPELNVGEVEQSLDTTNPMASAVVNTSINNVEERSIPVEVLVGIYGEDNTFRGCKTIKVTLNPGDNSVSVGHVVVNGYEPGMKLYGKILVWDSTYGTKPLVTAEKFEIK